MTSARAPRNTSAQPGDRYGVTSRCLGTDHDISVAGSWRDVTLQKAFPLQTCCEHNMLSLLHAVCLKVLVFFYTASAIIAPVGGRPVHSPVSNSAPEKSHKFVMISGPV